MVKKISKDERRKRRVRMRLRKLANGKPRLSVFRSSQHIYAQVIDDENGVTVAAASTKDKDFSGQKGSNKEAAGLVGKLVAERAKTAGVETVIFDRGGYLFHGRVKALAEAAREAGLKFYGDAFYSAPDQQASHADPQVSQSGYRFALQSLYFSSPSFAPYRLCVGSIYPATGNNI